jgi:hypothetical protein
VSEAKSSIENDNMNNCNIDNNNNNSNNVKADYTIDNDKVACVEDLIYNELNDTEIYELIRRLENKMKVSKVG